MDTYCQVGPRFVYQFLSSIYVDNLVTGSSDVESTYMYQFYENSRQRLAMAGFQLRKFVTNSDELRRRIQLNECRSENGGALPSCPECEVAVQEMGERITRPMKTSHMPSFHLELA